MHSLGPWLALLPALLAKLRAAVLLWLAWIASTVAAVEAPARRFAEPATASAATEPAAGLAQLTLALALVLGAIFAIAWAVRRFRLLGGGRPQSGTAITVLAERAVGPRERVVLLQVDDERILIGVATGSVRMLHVKGAAASDRAVELRR